MPDNKKSYIEFAASVKEKYPQYKDVDDMELAKKMVDKYPEYQSQVDFTVKKKDQTSGGVLASSLGGLVRNQLTDKSSIQKSADILKQTGIPLGTQVAQAPVDELGRPIESFSADTEKLYSTPSTVQAGGVDYFSELNKLTQKPVRDVSTLPRQVVGTEKLAQVPLASREIEESQQIEQQQIEQANIKREQFVGADVDKLATEFGLDAEQKSMLEKRQRELLSDYTTMPFAAEAETEKNRELEQFVVDAATMNKKKAQASKAGVSMEDLNYLEKRQNAERILEYLPDDMKAYNEDLFVVTANMRDLLSNYQDLSGGKGLTIDPETGKVDLSGIKDEKDRQYLETKLTGYLNEYKKIQENSYNTMNDRIVQRKGEAKQLETTIKRAEAMRDDAQTYEEKKRLEDLIEKGKRGLEIMNEDVYQMQRDKNSFFEVDPKNVKAEFKSSPSAQRLFTALPKDMSGKEKFDLYVSQLISTNKQIEKELGIDPSKDESFSAGMRDWLDWDGIYDLSEKEKEYYANKKIIRSLAPLYLNNTPGLTQKSGGLWNTFYSSFANWIQPKTELRSSETNIAREQLAVLQKEGFTAEDFSSTKNVDALQERVATVPLASAETAGEMLGTTGAIMAEIIVGGAVLTPLKGTKTVKSLANAYDKTMDSGKILRFVKPAVSQGIQMEAIGTMFSSAEDELNFTSGALGGLGGQLIGALSKKAGSETLAKYVSSVFGSNSNKAMYVLKRAGEINNRGLGEVGEEVTQELVGIYTDELRKRGFWEEVQARYGDVSDIGKLVVSSYIMGSAFGMNTKSAAKEWYNSLPKEEQVIVDNIEKEANTEVSQAAKAVVDKSDEIKEKAAPDQEKEQAEPLPAEEQPVEITEPAPEEIKQPEIIEEEGADTEYKDAEGNFYSEKEVLEMSPEDLSAMTLQNPSQEVKDKLKPVETIVEPELEVTEEVSTTEAPEQPVLEIETPEDATRLETEEDVIPTGPRRDEKVNYIDDEGMPVFNNPNYVVRGGAGKEATEGYYSWDRTEAEQYADGDEENIFEGEIDPEANILELETNDPMAYEEIEDNIRKFEEITGVKYDSESFSDVTDEMKQKLIDAGYDAVRGATIDGLSTFVLNKDIINPIPSLETKLEVETEKPVSDIPPTEPPAEEKSAPEEPEKKERRFAKQVTDSDISEEVKQGLTEDAKTYLPTSNDITVKEADAIIQAKGIDKAVRDVLDQKNELKPRVRVSMGIQLIKKLDEQGDYIEAANVANELSKFATELGQGVQAFSLWNKLSAEGIIASYVNDQNRVRKEKKKKLSGTYEGIQKGYKSGTKKAGKKAMENIFGKSKSKANKVKAFGLDKQEIERRKKAALEKLRKSRGGTLTAGGMNSETIEAIVEYGAMLFAEGVRNFKAWAKSVQEVAPDLTEEELKSIWMNNDSFGGKTFEELSKLAEIEDIVSDHFLKTDDKSELSKILQETFNLDKDLADGLANEITNEFNRIVELERKAEIKKNNIKMTKKVEQAIDDIAQLNGLTEKDIEKIIEGAFGIKDLTAEHIEKIKELVADRDQRPEGFLKDDGSREVLSYISGLNGIPKADIFWAIWYASVLSGYETQILNIASNALNIGMESVTSVIQKAIVDKDLGAAADIISGLWKGLKDGSLEFNQAITTGQSPRKVISKIEAKDTLENVKFKGWKAPANLYKYVGRFMSAVDSAAFFAAHGSKKQEIARETAKNEGLSGGKLRKRVSEIMNDSEETYNEAFRKATEEINRLYPGNRISERQKARLIKIRTSEIIAQKLPDEVTEEANKYASFVTYNYTPKGVLGVVASNLSALGERLPPFKLIVPFTRVVANVLNQQLDYTPYGYLRAVKWNVGARMTARTSAENARERQRQLIKATFGTVVMVTLYSMVKAYSDDDDPYFDITGKGPSDMNKRNQLYAQGWKPYSVKIGDTYISYQYTPIGLALSYIGNWVDNEKYNELSEKEWYVKSTFALGSSGKGLMDMSFLTGLSGFMDALRSDSNPEKSVDDLFKALARTGTSLVPNLFKQVDKIFDPTIYETKDIEAAILKEIPIVKELSDLKPKLNAFGQPAQKTGSKFLGEVTDDKIWKFMVNNKLFAPGLSPSSKKPDGTLMSDEEFYEYAKKSGELARKAIDENYSSIVTEFETLTQPEKNKYINDIFREAREEAKYELFE